MAILPAAKLLHDLRMLQGRVLVLGPDAVSAVRDLKAAGVEATAGVTDTATMKAAKAVSVPVVKIALRPAVIPKRFESILDLGTFAELSATARKMLGRAYLDALPQGGLLFIVGHSRTIRGAAFRPAAVKAAFPAKAVHIANALNYDGGADSRSEKGIVVPLEKLTRIPSPRELAIATKPAPKRANATRRTAVTALSAKTDSATGLVPNRVVLNPQPIVALQKCPNWCWAAALQMLCRSQGFDVDQKVFVKKIYGVKPNGEPPCNMSGPWSNIEQAIMGTVGTVNGKTLTLTGTATPYLPFEREKIRGLVRDLQKGEPFLFGIDAHIVVCHGATWWEATTGTGPIQITQLDFIDPYPDNQRLFSITFPTKPAILNRILGVMTIDVAVS